MTVFTLIVLIVAVGIALGFEVINGFHDTANAVATVIYTKSLRPQVAVVWSGVLNFLGVLLGGIAVAFSIVHLLPVDMLVHIDSGAGMAMVLALLLAAMIWNFGTWFLAIPASSSHALIGAIIGVGLVNSGMMGHFGSGVNWKKAGDVGLSLLISPLIGFALAAGALLLFKRLAPNPKLHVPPAGEVPPPWWIRGLLIFTCSGVSFAHGSNDGQKGIGLLMLILIGLVPSQFAMNLDMSKDEFQKVVQATDRIHGLLDDPDVRGKLAATRPPTAPLELALAEDAPKDSVTDLPPQYGLSDPDLSTAQELVGALRADLVSKPSPKELPADTLWGVRTKTLLIEQVLHKLEPRLEKALTEEKAAILGQSRSTLRGAVEYAPTWVLVAVALALGLGTMVGWKRIVVTVGEKIGKTHLTYSQGASAELVAMTTIGLADVLGMPVSTTHVLSSGVAGTMAANRSGLQMSTLKSIALAWILTLPATMALSGLLYYLFRMVV
jgi:PiT family inorganic phosphate transporter